MTPDQEICGACGKPLGVGSLLDFQPEVPKPEGRTWISQEQWEDFAARYLCPNCAANRPHARLADIQAPTTLLP